MKNKLVLVGCLALLNSVAEAGNWNAGARLSSLGLAAEGGYQFNETFALRLQGTWWEHFKKRLSYDNVKYHNVRFRPITVTAYADWYFYTKWWRLSAGLGYNATKIRLNRDFSNHPKPERAAAGIVSAKYRFRNPLKYYVGTGIDIKKIGGSNWTFSMDAGAYFMGKVKAKVQMTGPAKDIPQAQAVAKREAEELLNDKKWFATYPAVSVGFKYEF